MSAKNGFETDLLKLYYQNISIPNIGDSGGLRGSVVAGYSYIAIYSVSPSDSEQGTECSYPGYARVAVPRSESGFTVVGNNLSNAIAVIFPQCTSGSDSAVAFTINRGSVAGVDDADKWGALQSVMSITPGNQPHFAIGDLNINVD